MNETKWLSEDERAAWVRFTAVLEMLPTALDLQLTTDEELTHFGSFTLAIFSEAPGCAPGTSALAARTSATLPQLSSTRSARRGRA
ncbi:hypothetical protein ITJ58_18415 [Curtobacterium flaccumfaciens]|uniref:hypothetical protein n=1 Tax=Curtobacterium flaccumfaciens TaxID=2035 RepID=UPI00188D716E|nr:hypothetical protein [Curtobacterium flaccumfaciens]MBF4595736.1 hypothetical protein [Curtobacterium flaccumfaciens]